MGRPTQALNALKTLAIVIMLFGVSMYWVRAAILQHEFDDDEG